MSTHKTTLYIKKVSKDSELKSTQKDFGFAVCSTTWADETIKELPKREWPGEHGEDTYIPADGLRLQAYDIEVELSYKGKTDTALAKYKDLRAYLLGLNGDGAEMMIYDPYWKKGRQRVYVKSISDITPNKSDIDEIINVTVTFRVTDPITEVKAVTNSKQEITNLAPDELAN